MGQVTENTNTENLAKDGITQAAAEGTPGSADPAESKTAEAARTAPENPFSSEDAELAQLEAQAKADAETAGKATEKGTKTDGDGTEQAAGTSATKAGDTTATVADATKEAAAAGHNASTAAIVALRKRNQELSGALLVKEGENRVLKTLVDPEKFSAEAGESGRPAQQLTVDEEFEALAAERIRIAEEVDGGRMTMREYAEQTNEIQARERALSLALANEAAQQPVNDLGLQEHVTTLLQRFPILNTLTGAQLKPFEQIAYEQAAMEGKPIQPGPVGTRDLRERMGALATQVYGKPAAAVTAGANGTGAAATGSTVVAQPTAAEREAKLALAGNHPPNIGITGSGATGGEPTEAQATAALSQGEDAAIRWLESNPGFVQKQMGKSVRLTR